MASSSLIDVARFNAVSSGTGDFVVSSAVTGYQTPAGASAVNGAQYSYRAESSDLSQWEVGYGTYTTGTTTLARSTVLYNSSGTTSKISFTAAPQVAITALGRDIRPPTATLQASPADPTGTSSSTGVMMGLGSTCNLTLLNGSRVSVTFQGSVTNNTTAAAALFQVRYGTGTAPSNGAALTGTTVGSQIVFIAPNTTASFPMLAGGIITGLNPGTAYWFDLALSASPGTSTSNINRVSCSAMEF